MSEQSTQPTKKRGLSLLGYAIVLVFIFGVIWPLQDEGVSVSLWGLSMPAWVMAFLSYILGIAAAWAATRKS